MHKPRVYTECKICTSHGYICIIICPVLEYLYCIRLNGFVKMTREFGKCSCLQQGIFVEYWSDRVVTNSPHLEFGLEENDKELKRGKNKTYCTRARTERERESVCSYVWCKPRQSLTWTNAQSTKFLINMFIVFVITTRFINENMNSATKGNAWKIKKNPHRGITKQKTLQELTKSCQQTAEQIHKLNLKSGFLWVFSSAVKSMAKRVTCKDE